MPNILISKALWFSTRGYIRVKGPNSPLVWIRIDPFKLMELHLLRTWPISQCWNISQYNQYKLYISRNYFLFSPILLMINLSLIQKEIQCNAYDTKIKTHFIQGVFHKCTCLLLMEFFQGIQSINSIMPLFLIGNKLLNGTVGNSITF